MVLRCRIRSLRQLCWILKMLNFVKSQTLPKDVRQKIAVICEEFFTNFFKYANTPKKRQCWLKFVITPHQITLWLFSDEDKFDPFSACKDGVGVRLLTQLSKTRYRYFNGFNCLKICFELL